MIIECWLRLGLFLISLYIYYVEYRHAMKCPSFDDLFTTGVALNKRRL
jgi:hypothetical protein